MSCAICQDTVVTGQGQAIFTAECSHTFHFDCIARNVQHGNLCCPICRTIWLSLPFQLPPVFPNPLQNNFGSPVYNPEPVTFSDDEPLPPPSTTSPTPVSVPQTVAIKTYTEYSAIAAAESRPTFPVLVSIRAPALQGGNNAHDRGRTPIDLVTVLDVSGSMEGTKIDLLKRAVNFVIQNLGTYDRLSIVSFSSTARRVLPLRRMTVEGCQSAMLAIQSLTAGGGTDIVEGLKTGVQVLEERRERNPVSTIILLSDGLDNSIYDSWNTSSLGQQVSGLLNRLPTSVRGGNIPVHTFGFGSDHDATTMHAISNSSGGTFSFIESIGMIQDAFALCIGGLLSIVAQELRLTVRSASQGVQIISIPSGRHVNEISDERQQGVVNVGNMYAEEEKQFLVYLLVPASPATENVDGVNKTRLLDVSCVYKDLASNELISVQGERIEILRPEAPADEAVCLKVDRQRNRILVAEGIAAAHAMAETGNLAGAQAILEQRRATLLSSAAAQAGDDLSSWLEVELKQIKDKMASRESYNQFGRAFALSGMSSHSAQRATTRGDMTAQFSSMRPGASPGILFRTTEMESMVRKSKNHRGK